MCINGKHWNAVLLVDLDLNPFLFIVGSLPDIIVQGVHMGLYATNRDDYLLGWWAS